MTTTGYAAPAGPAASSPAVAATMRHSLTLAWRSLVQIKHNPFELFDVSLQPIMFVLLFTYMFGGAIDGSPHNYLQFLLPGIIVQNALFLTMNTGVGLCTDLSKGTFDRFRSLPIARSAPLAGRVVADVARQIWSILVLLATGLVLGFRFGTGPLSVLAAIVLLALFCMTFSWVAVWAGVSAREPEKVGLWGFTVVFPLTFTSDAFVHPTTLPGWLQAWVRLNPVTQLADGMRGLLVGGPVVAPVLTSLGWAAGFTVVFLPLALQALRRRV